MHPEHSIESSTAEGPPNDGPPQRITTVATSITVSKLCVIFYVCIKESCRILQDILCNGWLHFLSVICEVHPEGCFRKFLGADPIRRQGLRVNVRKSPAVHFLGPAKQREVDLSLGWFSESFCTCGCLGSWCPAKGCRWIWPCSPTPSRPSVSCSPCLMSALNKVRTKCQGLRERLGRASHLSLQTARQGCEKNYSCKGRCRCYF